MSCEAQIFASHAAWYPTSALYDLSVHEVQTPTTHLFGSAASALTMVHNTTSGIKRDLLCVPPMQCRKWCRILFKSQYIKQHTSCIQLSLHKASLKQNPTAHFQSGDAHANSLCVEHSSLRCEACAACCTLQGKWGEDLYSPVPRPMFLVRLVTVAGQLMYDPPLDTIEQAVLEAFDAIVLRSANIDEITTKVSLGAA